jgi:hypothetical protein
MRRPTSGFWNGAFNDTHVTGTISSTIIQSTVGNTGYVNPGRQQFNQGT